MSDESDAINKAAQMLAIDRDEITKRMEKMPVNDVIDALDAVASGDEARVRELLGNEVGEDGSEDAPANVEDDDEFDINPLFLKNHDGTKKAQNGEEVEEESFSPNIGDEVRVNGEDGIVKVVHGPNNTTGVMIDGQTTMVKKAQVKRVKTQESVIEEGLMGMTPMIDLRRMQELAGMAPGGSPLAPGRVDVEGPPAPLEAIEVSVEPQTAPMPTPTACAAPVASQAAPEVNLTGMSIDGVMSSFDQIEAALPNIALADAKTVRERINAVLAILNEGLDGRKRKF
ncbi:MAG: hypothetical protein EOP83_10275 [Verrucomicrobiaceae bacterium]|nr:MAG: hypothetical protein EOP83_10275 [Verrucomicrobiaceae bacterium]